MNGDEPPCETCGGVVTLVDGEPVCVRDSWCVNDSGCDGRSHSIYCNNIFYGARAKS